MNLFLYSTIVSLCWGLSPVLYKLLMNNVDIKVTFVINSLFFTLAVICYTIYYWNDIKSNLQTTSVSDICFLGLISVVLSFIPNIIYFNLLNQYDSYVVNALVSTSPFFTLGMAYLILRESITKYDILGVILIITGVFFLSCK